MNNTVAKIFARVAHGLIRHKRKYSGERYTVHTEAVNKTVMKYGGTSEQGQASHLHDYPEDVVTKLKAQGRLITLAILQFFFRRLFNERVRRLVFELTDQYSSEDWPQLTRKVRKGLERERVAGISDAAKEIKLADLLDNTSSIVAYDPDFAVTYLAEKAEMLPLLKGEHVNEELYAKVEKQLRESVKQLKAQWGKQLRSAQNQLEKLDKIGSV